MTGLFVVIGFAVALAVGVTALLFNDRKQHERTQAWIQTVPSELPQARPRP